MGRRGPAPKPRELEILQGRPGHRPDNDRAPAIAAGPAPRCPGWLKAAAKTEWRRIAKVLRGAGLLKSIDQAALAAYCQSYGRWVEAEQKVEEKGEVITMKRFAPGGLKYKITIVNPWLKVADSARADMLRFMKEFGLTPAGRGRLIVDDSGQQKTDGVGDLLAALAFGEGARPG